MPNKEPTKELRELALEILDTVGSTKATRNKEWKENALQYIEIRIQQALSAREEELVEKVKEMEKGNDYNQPDWYGERRWVHGYVDAIREVIALIKG